MSPEKEAFLKKVETVCDKRLYTRGPLMKALGLDWALKVRSENDHFQVLEASGPAAGFITAVELRERRKEKRDGLIILRVAPELGLTMEDLRGRYGGIGAFHPPNAHMPAGSPSYSVYERPQGELRWSFMLDALPKAPVLAVVIDSRPM
jgi:hypothetical protein